jgi:hypothetical protein
VKSTPEVRQAISAKANAVRSFGREDPRTAQASRDLAAAWLIAADARAREAGLSELDRMAIVKTGELAPSATAGAAA